MSEERHFDSYADEYDAELQKGINYFVHQYIKIGAFVGGAGLKEVTAEEGKKGVLECKLAQESPGIASAK